MTNGEKFCIDFPNIRIEVFVSYVQVVGENYEFNNLYPLKWWNAEYKEPTTKENLAVDCIDRKKLIDWINIWDITPIIKNPLIRHIQGMSSATPQEPTKNDLAVDCVARQDVERYIEGFINEYTPKEELEFINLELDGLKHLPSVTPQEPILDQISEIIEPLRHLPIGEMSDIEWDILRVIDKYKGESEG